MSKSRRDMILDRVKDLVSSLMYYDRKDDEDVPRGAIQGALRKGELTKEQMVEEFRKELREAEDTDVYKSYRTIPCHKCGKGMNMTPICSDCGLIPILGGGKMETQRVQKDSQLFEMVVYEEMGVTPTSEAHRKELEAAGAYPNRINPDALDKLVGQLVAKLPEQYVVFCLGDDLTLYAQATRKRFLSKEAAAVYAAGVSPDRYPFASKVPSVPLNTNGYPTGQGGEAVPSGPKGITEDND